MNTPLTAWRNRARTRLAQLTPRQRQSATLALVLAGGIGLLWLVFATTTPAPRTRDTQTATGPVSAVTNIGVLPPGGQVNPVDQWVGTAGRKLAQYEAEREEQARLNRDRQGFETRTAQRIAELEQRIGASGPAASTRVLATGPLPPASTPPSPASPSPPTPALTSAGPVAMPPASALPRAAVAPMRTWDPATSTGVPAMAAAPQPLISRLQVSDAAPSVRAARRDASDEGSRAASSERNEASFLPISFTRGVLLGGLDAPTGGQSQSNPHPVLIRLSDNAVLPNRFRGAFRECFVVAAGYGDISSERAYLRTESLSCVRHDGAALEVRIQGAVYGEDGKVGMRGRLVTKQGQMLANALLAGVVSGIGQGVAAASTETSTSALGSVTSSSGADAYRAGLGSGVGKALDRLAQYYIKLAENTFPVIEVDAGREIDVVITRGVRIDMPWPEAESSRAGAALPRRSNTTGDEESSQTNSRGRDARWAPWRCWPLPCAPGQHPGATPPTSCCNGCATPTRARTSPPCVRRPLSVSTKSGWTAMWPMWQPRLRAISCSDGCSTPAACAT